MINHYNPIVAWALIIYLTLSFASMPALVGYWVYKLIGKLRQGRLSNE